ncbi:hypothetical protein BJX61DRAFT_548260 [Aspergillus egyptiacus]|nr:hypothetical protein BJX61DRAFT_548260 [Aspergillus egyptiacus]
MAPNQSHLANPKYGYDFVVATTQESINAGLVQYLQNTQRTQPFTYLCFLADNDGNPTTEVSLDELRGRSGGLSPFDIPDNTDYSDNRIQKLTEARLVCAIRMRTGIPPGCVAKDPRKGPQIRLPEPIVTLGDSAENVKFNMYCSDITIIKNTPPSGWGNKGSWKWFQQPSANPWYISTQTNIQNAALDKNLDTPYFRAHPEERDALRRKLDNLSGTAFSLQQLLVNLDNAVAQSVPSFHGVNDKGAEYLLGKSFIQIWTVIAKKHGLPLVGVSAVAQRPDGSPLRLTALERWVSPVVDASSGEKIKDPSALELSATTLNYLCATDGRQLPGASTFSWNWIDPQDVTSSSGVISIKRSTMASFLTKKILPQARRSCIKTSASVKARDVVGGVTYSWGFSPGQEPTVKFPDSGPIVATMDYSCTSKGSDKMAWTYGELKLSSTYSCNIVFGNHDWTGNPLVCLGGNTFTVVQNLKMYVYMQWSETGRGATIVNKTLTDQYVVSVDDNGGLTSSPTGKSTSTDNGEDIDVSWIVNAFTGVGDLLKAVKNKSAAFLNAQISSIPFNDLQSFVFPGARVFSYKSAAFSHFSDLTCLITYVNPTDSQPQEQASISTSTDLMLNYVQGELVKPQGKFRALQTANGAALLFAIDSSGVFNVMEETIGQTQTGWRATDMSSKIIQDRFPSGAVVRQFDVGQSVMSGNTISLAMSVRSNGSDTLFLSLLNSPSSTSEWITKPTWNSIHITNIYISETDQQQQYILVDILRDPESSLKAIDRYVVDPFLKSGPYWTPCSLPFEVEEGTYQSCLGRVPSALADGIYTAGTVKDVAQLAYVPLFNSFGNAAPMPTRLRLPNRTNRPSYGTTDLYAVGQSTLYRWDPDHQLDNDTEGTALLTSSVFAGTDTLIALIHDKITTIFGRNASNVVYYTSCHVDHLADPQSWSVPVPVLRGIERITSYINLRDGGNTLTQATNTESKLWQAQPILLQASRQSKAMSFKSYTSTIKVKGPDGMPHTPVYIDGLYYVLSTIPVTVPVNASGEVIVVQGTDSLVGSIIHVKLGSEEQAIDPMANSYDKLAKLSDRDALKNAQIRTNTVAGGLIGAPKSAPLVASPVSDTDLEATAAGMRLLKEAYGKHQSRAAKSSLDMTAPVTSAVVASQGSARFGFGDYITIAAGDLFNWLKTGVEKIVNVVKNAATGLWEFIVSIGKEVYRAVLNTVDAVVGAVEWVFNKIKTGVEKLIQYVEFLFEWDDIRRTKQVMHNLVKYYMMDMASGIDTARREFDNCIAGAQRAVADWSGIHDWTPLGESASKPPAGNASDPTKHQTSGSQMLAGHFRNQADHITMPQGMPEAGSVQSLVDDLMKAMESQGEVFMQTYNQLKDLAADFLKLSLADILRRLAGILVETVLGSTQVVVDAMLKVLRDLASTAIAVLDTKIHIPIISDILNAIGVPDISFLDLFTWIGAAGITVIFKVARGQAPFADNATTRALIDARDWSSFSAVFKQPVSFMSMVASPAPDAAHRRAFGFGLSDEIGQLIYSAGHAIAGFVAFTGNFLFFAEAMDVSPTNVFGMPSAIMGVIGAAAAGGADFLAAKMPIENKSVSTLRSITTVATVLSKIIFSGPGQKYLARGKLSFLKVNDNRKIGAVFNTALVFPALFCSCYHFYELSKQPPSKQRSLAIIGETSSMVQYIGRVSYCVAVFDPDPVTRIVPVSVMAGSNVVMFGLETAGAVIF